MKGQRDFLRIRRRSRSEGRAEGRVRSDQCDKRTTAAEEMGAFLKEVSNFFCFLFSVFSVSVFYLPFVCRNNFKNFSKIF